MGNFSGRLREVRTLTSDPHPELGVFVNGSIPYETIGSMLGIAISTDNVMLLRLQKRSILTFKDRDGNSLLHLAIINNSWKVFKYLVKQEDMDKNAYNDQNFTPLLSVPTSDKKCIRYVQELIKNGADVNMPDGAGNIALHHAVNFTSPKNCEFLITCGSDINRRNKRGETPLQVACRRASEEIIYMLLCYGADATVPCNNGFLPLMTSRLNSFEMDLRLTLYYFTFDNEETVMELRIAIVAMSTKWSLFPHMLKRITNFVYNTYDLEALSEALPEIEPTHLRMFLEKFQNILKEMFLHCCAFTKYVTTIDSMRRLTVDIVQFMNVLSESDLWFDFVESRCVSISPISSLVKIFSKHNLPLQTLTNFVCLMMSNGVDVTPDDLNAVYVFYGHCELFQIMLHMDIVTPDRSITCCPLYNHEVPQKSIMPYFIYDVNLNIEKFLKEAQSYLNMDMDVLLDYFALPKLIDFFLRDGTPSSKVMKKIKSLPSVPSLVELSRDRARSHIINVFAVRKSSQFYTIIRWLPISPIYKKILSFETKLYYD